jgi:hypothetical protein
MVTMRLRQARLAISTAAALAGLGAALVPGCGGSSSKKVLYDPDASLGDAGAGGAAGSSLLPVGGSSGASNVGGASAEAGASGQREQAGEGGLAGSSSSIGGAGGAAGTPPSDIDAGIGCNAPSVESTISPASAGLPSSGLRLWLRGDHGVYKTDDDRVCAWADQSGNDYVFSASADTARPLWDATGVGGMPAVHFDASGRFLSIGGVLGLGNASARTLVAVVQLVSTSGRFAAIQQGQDGTPGTYLAIDTNTFDTAGNREGVYLMNNSFDSALATATTPRVHVYTIGTMTPGTPILDAISYRVNGAVQTLTRNSGGLGNGNFEDFSGANFSLVGNVETGSDDALIAEALVYDRALSSTESASVEQALEGRYGIH